MRAKVVSDDERRPFYVRIDPCVMVRNEAFTSLPSARKGRLERARSVTSARRGRSKSGRWRIGSGGFRRGRRLIERRGSKPDLRI